MMHERCDAVIGRALALGAVATMVAVAHSWIAPVSVAKIEPARPVQAGAASARPSTGAPVVTPSNGTPADIVDERMTDATGLLEETGPNTEIGTAIDAEIASESDTTTEPAASGDQPWYYISTEEGLAIFETGEAAFVDARHENEFVAGHIAGAYFLPAFEFNAAPGRVFLEFALPEQLIVIYCGGGECDASQNTANRIAAAGYTNYRILHEGYDAWITAGGETAAGPDLFGAIEE